MEPGDFGESESEALVSFVLRNLTTIVPQKGNHLVVNFKELWNKRVQNKALANRGIEDKTKNGKTTLLSHLCTLHELLLRRPQNPLNGTPLYNHNDYQMPLTIYPQISL